MALQTAIGNDLAQELRAETLIAALRERQLRPCRGPYKDYVHILLLAEGTLHLEAAELSRDFEGPAALILPPASDPALRLAAGASGWLLGLSPALLGELTGTRPEREMMLPLAKSVIIAGGGQAGDDSAQGPLDLELLTESLMDEIATARAGFRSAVHSYLRLIILEIWRNAYQEKPVARFTSEGHILEGFRHEVEIHFRSHMPVAGYAAHLGLSESRLRRICQRHLHRSPLQLIHQRLMREAVIWLGHSGRTVTEIAQALGFGDSAEFSHFFKRLSGQSPSQFREELALANRTDESHKNRFADWP